jgi:hypothetical protein
MRDITVPGSYPQIRRRLAIFLVASGVVTAGVLGVLIFGIVDHWSTGAIVVLAIVALVLVGGVAARTHAFLRMRADTQRQSL